MWLHGVSCFCPPLLVKCIFLLIFMQSHSSFSSFGFFTSSAASTKEEGLVPIWEDISKKLKDCLGSIVLPIGSLSIGLCRHRALLFKVCTVVSIVTFYYMM